ncbi:MAG: hypothetical protein HYT76_08705 [Deltaproteobacteria bacterium]|nr:hypothetical protein [Deltaproteobacteria bacterium]
MFKRILLTILVFYSLAALGEEFFSDGGYEGKMVWGKMVATIPAPPQFVWEIYIDVNQWDKIGIARLIDSRLVNLKIVEQVKETDDVDDLYEALGPQVFSVEPLRRKGGEWRHLHFQFFNVPWPISNKWLVLDMKDIETRSERGIYRAEWTLAAGNLESMEGYIQFEPNQGDRKTTRLEYYVKVNPGSHVPKFLVRWAVNSAMPRTIQAIRRETVRRLTLSSGKHPSSSGS